MGGAGLFTRMRPYRAPTPRPTINDRNNTFISIPPESPELECETVATQAPKTEFAQHLQVRFCPARCRVLDMRTGSGVGCANCFALPLCITPIFFHRRPAWSDGQCRRRQFREFLGGINGPPTDNREHGFELLDLLIRDREIVGGKNGQVRQLPSSKSSLLTIFC